MAPRLIFRSSRTSSSSYLLWRQRATSPWRCCDVMTCEVAVTLLWRRDMRCRHDDVVMSWHVTSLWWCYVMMCDVAMTTLWHHDIWCRCEAVLTSWCATLPLMLLWCHDIWCCHDAVVMLWCATSPWRCCDVMTLGWCGVDMAVSSMKTYRRVWIWSTCLIRSWSLSEC